MVKNANIMVKNLWKSIRSSLGRYIAIVSIIALGAAMFVGLRMTKTDMIATGQQYMDELNMFDLRLLSSYGWSEDSLAQISQMEGVAQAEGVKTLDAIVDVDGSDNESVYKLYNIPQDVNRIRLQGGRLPQSPDECLADGYHSGKKMLGKTITLSEGNPDSVFDSLNQRSFTVVGYVSSPIFMNMERGNTSLGSGQVSGFLYLPEEAFSMDYYTEIDITTSGHRISYSDAYEDRIEGLSDALEPLLKPVAQERADQVLADAEKDYAEGVQKYEDGKKEFEESQIEVYGQLGEAYEKLIRGQEEIDENRSLLEESSKQIEDGRAVLQSSMDALADSSATLAQTKADTYAQLAAANTELLAQYKTVVESRRQVEEGLTKIDAGLTTVNNYITTLNMTIIAGETALSQMETMLYVMDTSIAAAEKALEYVQENGTSDEETIAEMAARLEALKATQEEYRQKQEETQAKLDEAKASLSQLEAQRDELEAQKASLQENKSTLDAAMDQLDIAFLELQNGQTQADNQFAAAESQIQAGQMKLDASMENLDLQEAAIEKGFIELDSAQQEIDDGWIEYHNGMREADAAMAEARQELEDAGQTLRQAREDLDSFAEPSVFLLGRDTNAGYIALDENSDIVSGVARVFPVFFLLVAALVCITTMTRMVSEERTQIGTLKAMGYRNWEIMGKYLFYSGSAAIFGCTLGVLAGSVIFPQVLWKAYSIMFHISDWVVMKLDVPLCIAVVTVYTGVSLAVTWYCCSSELREVPAELIRPKAPTSGKKILLEYLPFWKHISFLNKVMFRNIFRYRQRLAMMILGIGGCMALLMTGFGISDSILGFADLQFSEITTYDVEVFFGEEQTEDAQKEFRDEYRSVTENMMFFSQKSVTMEHEGNSKSIYLITAGDNLTNFIHLQYEGQEVSMPKSGEAILSVGAAESLGIRVGDTISTRDSDMNTLQLTVSGIFENHVYNYLIVHPETVASQQGTEPEIQMAYMTLREGVVDTEIAARLTEDPSVYNVLVSSSLAGTVNKMMDAMDMVVWVVVICAGALGAIVLYNLTNININERVREIATIKVLGFNSLETAAYVFKENLALAAMGGLMGTLFGKYLLSFVMSQIKIDMVWFSTVITLKSILISFAFTMLTALLVDVVFFPRLENINMAEALKSVE